MPLSDIALRTAKPTDKPYKLTDGGGLYVEVYPTGGKLWRLKYRFGGKEKRLSLGAYPVVSLKDARERRDNAKRLLAGGIDPSVERKAQKAATVERAANSFETVGREWFARYSPTWAESHSTKIIRRLEADIFPWLGGRPIAEITAPEVLTVLRRIEGRGALDTAHRAHQNCGQIFRYAVATGRAVRDPSGDLRGALPPAKHENFASITDPAQVAALLRAIDAFRGTLVVRCALLLAPMVFVRPGELRKAEWADFDLDAGEWRYLVSKTKTAHLVPLPNWTSSKLAPAFVPGERWQYSGEGYALLQAVISAVAGQDYETCASKTVFEPIGMQRSALHLTDDIRKHLVHGSSTVQLAFSEPNAAASLYTTAQDYAKFISALLADTALLELTLAKPIVADSALGMTWGYGWGIETTSNDTYLWHWGNNPGYRAFAMVSLSSRNGFVLFTNSDHGMPLAATLAHATIPAEHRVFRFSMLG